MTAEPDQGRGAAGLAAPPGWFSNALFWPFWFCFGGLLRLWFRMRVEGAPPRRGAYVLAANHASFLDPLLVSAVVPRRIVYLMTEVVWRSAALGWFCRWNKSIPLAARTANRDALRAARSVLQQGRVVGIFPEGGLSRDGLPMLGNPGAVSLVLTEGVAIVPVGIVGAHAALPPGACVPRPRRITVRFGAPIHAAELDALAPGDRRARLQAATRLIMARIGELTGHEPREVAVRRATSAKA